MVSKKIKCEQTVDAKVDKHTGATTPAHRCNSYAMEGSNFCAAHTRKAKYGMPRCTVVLVKRDKNCEPVKRTARQLAVLEALRVRGVEPKPKTCKNRAMPGSTRGYCALHSQILEGTLTKKTKQPRKNRKTCSSLPLGAPFITATSSAYSMA